MTLQTAHNKYKWQPYATEWTPPHENFLRTPLQQVDPNIVRIALLFCKGWEFWTSRTLSKSYFSGVQSQNIFFTAASSWSRNSISSTVPHKKISIRAHDEFSQHGYFSEKISKSITNFL